MKKAAASSLWNADRFDPVRLAACTDGVLDQSGCDTRHDQPAWIRVDLEKDTVVVGIKVYQIYHFYRFFNIGVNVGYSQNWKENAVCLPDVQNVPKPFIELDCTKPVRGRYVHLFRERARNIISVAEFEVYGYYVDWYSSNIQQKET